MGSATNGVKSKADKWVTSIITIKRKQTKKNEEGGFQMEHILIMTRNILSDKELQEKLQHLNYEVFCSSSIMDHLLTHHCYSELLTHFKFIIFSETVSNAEIEYLLPCFEKKGHTLFRKVCDTSEIEEQVFNEVIPLIDLTMESLRELLMKSRMQNGKNSPGNIESSFSEKIRVPEQIDQLNLSRLEKKVFIELYHSIGKIVTREELCKSIWNVDVRNSHLSHISAIIKKMRIKFKKLNLPEDAIRTVWGEGYVLSPEFFYVEEAADSIVRLLA